jgi:hypothetical protein
MVGFVISIPVRDDDPAAAAKCMRAEQEKIECHVIGDQLMDWFAKLSKAARERTIQARAHRSTFERWLVYERALAGDC